MFEEYISRGTRYLNERYKEELNPWYKTIDLDILDMNDPDNCILGQLEGNYLHSNTTYVECNDNGFTVPTTVWHNTGLPFGRLYSILTDEWAQAIKKLQGEPANV